MDELLQEPEALDFQLDPMGEFAPPAPTVPMPPRARPMPPQSPQGLEGFVAQQNLPRIVRPDNSLIEDSYRNIPGAPVAPPQPPDPMQMLYQIARSGNRHAQTAFIHSLQVQSNLSHRERIQMQRMEAAIGTITNDPGLMFEEKVNAVRQLQTGIDFYKKRDQAAQQKAMMEQRQAQADMMKHQAAQMSAIQNMNDAEMAKWSQTHFRQLPNGYMLYTGGGKPQLVAPEKEQGSFDKDYAEAIKTLTTKDELSGATKAPAAADIEKYINEKNALRQKMTGKPSEQPQQSNAAQDEMNAIIRDLRDMGINKASQAPPDVQQRMKALIQQGAKP